MPHPSMGMPAGCSENTATACIDCLTAVHCLFCTRQKGKAPGACDFATQPRRDPTNADVAVSRSKNFKGDTMLSTLIRTSRYTLAAIVAATRISVHDQTASGTRAGIGWTGHKREPSAPDIG